MPNNAVMKQPLTSTIIVCGIVRNAEAGLRRNIPAVSAICARFKDYKIVIFENDSTDGTKRLLEEWQATDPEHIKCEMVDMDSSCTIPKAGSVDGNPFFSERRISKMAYYRNKYLNYVYSHSLSADYLMVVDLDVARIFPEAVFSSFRDCPEWDAVTAFGYSTSPQLRRRYHDTYIFQEWENRGEAQTESHMLQAANKYGGLKPGDPWVRVAAAFGGLAIYRFEAIKGLKYQVIPNNDNQVTVYGEHYSIYKQMMDNGYDRFYLNPAMYLKYQKITPRIVWNSFKRKLFKK